MVVEQVPEIEAARAALRLEAWEEAYHGFRAVDPSRLTAADLDGLADAAWWVSRVEESLAARQKAYSAYVAAGDRRRAARAAWQMATEFGFRGEQAVANGWINRARRDLENETDCVEHGYIAISESHLAHQRGHLEEARQLAARVIEIGRRYSDADLTALGVQSEGRLLIAQGKIAEGAGLLDEAMTAVIAGELSALITGWIYCQVVWACLELADLERAGEWAEAAKRWCENLPEDAPYPGMCRLNRVELISMRGTLGEAESEALRASDQLMSYDPYLAGEAFYAIGEIRRRRGDLAGAEEAFARAHELGREPQPGLALIRLSQGKADEAATALRLASAGPEWNRLGRARLLAAQVEIAIATSDLDWARPARGELDDIAAESGTPVLLAVAQTARGRVLLAEQQVDRAVEELRGACHLWQSLKLPYESAEARTLLGLALGAGGDDEGAARELRKAAATLEEMGAAGSARSISRLLSNETGAAGGLTDREIQVLRLVAGGRTNREVAKELVISEHTVGRHLQNIFVKIGVTSRAAATAFAVENDLI